jgi:hypothetical protein
VLLAIFLKQYGAAPQVVAASLVLVVALSAALEHLPYQDDKHNQIEKYGIQACLLQLMVALLCNLVQDEGGKGGNDRLGPTSTACATSSCELLPRVSLLIQLALYPNI